MMTRVTYPPGPGRVVTRHRALRSVRAFAEKPRGGGLGVVWLTFLATVGFLEEAQFPEGPSSEFTSQAPPGAAATLCVPVISGVAERGQRRLRAVPTCRRLDV